MLPGPSEQLRNLIGTRIRALVGAGQIDLTRPPGDDGLFGPGSVAWRVHGDFAAMMVGGVSALLLQMLHPSALAGVWDHSDWRRNRLGRLRRTAHFISITTFGSTAAATAAIDQVRAIHDRVGGTLPDGTPYSANDPALLTWVHVAEVDSFLRAHLAFRDPGMLPGEQDRYLREMATIARRLGACDVPESRAAIADYYRAVRPHLRSDARTRAAAAALLASGPETASGPALRFVGQAATELLPPWAAALHGRAPAAIARPAIRSATRAMSGVVRWALARR